MSWVEEKAYQELSRVREARAQQAYPYFRAFESGGLHTSIAGKPVVNFSSNDLSFCFGLRAISTELPSSTVTRRGNLLIIFASFRV